MSRRHRWRSLTWNIQDGALIEVIDDEGGLLAERIGLSVGGDWVADDDDPLSWSLVRADGRAHLHGEWQLDGDELQLVMVLSSPFTAEVVGPKLVVDSAWPSQRVSVGSRHSAVLIDALRPDGSVVVLASNHRAGDWSHPLDGSPMQVTASRLPRQLTWRAAFSAHADVLTGLVPTWLPRPLVDEGDEIEIALPDAGVVAQTLTAVSTDRGVAMALPAGRHQVIVHQAHDSAEVSLWGRPLHQQAAIGPAGQAMAALRAPAGGGLQRAQHELEEAMHQPGEVSPLLLCAVAAYVGVSGQRELLEDALDRLATAPGRVLAQVRAAVAFASLGDRGAALSVGVAQWSTEDRALDTCLRAETAVLTGATVPTAEVRAMCGLWGRGLPVDELALEWVAPWTVVWRHAPESWRVDDGWLLDQAQVLEWARVRVQLDHPTHPAADWLLM